jgi:hypothetical protein
VIRLSPPLIAAVTASLALMLAYAVLGGLSYRPMNVANPCDSRVFATGGDNGDVAQRVALAALDGAACKLGVSRETLALALRTRGELDRFAQRRHLSDGEIEDAVRTGLTRGVDEAEHQGAVSGVELFLLRQTAERLPVNAVLDLLRRAPINW